MNSIVKQMSIQCTRGDEINELILSLDVILKTGEQVYNVSTDSGIDMYLTENEIEATYQIFQRMKELNSNLPKE